MALPSRPLLLAAACATGLIAACAQTPAPSSAAPNQPEPVVLLVPVQVSAPELESGCWAQFYDKRNFEGEVTTLLGPAELNALDKGTGRALKRDIDSLVVGPKAMLTVYQHQGFRDKSAGFEPNAREGGLIQKLGFGGRIESIRLDCSS